jgi:hypothetical protein
LEPASSTTMPAVLSGESEKDNLPIGMNWGARMVDSLLATTEASESSKERLVTGGDAENDICSDVVEKEGDDEASDSKFTEIRFRMLLIRQLLEEELSKPSILKIRTVSANDVRLPPENEDVVVEHRRVPTDRSKATESSSRSQVAPAAPEDPAEAGAFLLQLVKERDNEKETSSYSANNGAHLLKQLQGGSTAPIQQQASHPSQNPPEAKKVAESTSKGSSWTPTLRPSPNVPTAPARSDGVAEGAALLGLLQGGAKAEQDGAAMGSALLRQLQGGTSEAPVTSSKSPAWQGGQTWESSTQWENANSRRQRGTQGGKSRSKKGDEWW